MATGLILYHLNLFRKREKGSSPFSYSCLLLCPDDLFRNKVRESPTAPGVALAFSGDREQESHNGPASRKDSVFDSNCPPKSRGSHTEIAPPTSPGPPFERSAETTVIC